MVKLTAPGSAVTQVDPSRDVVDLAEGGSEVVGDLLG
jgi:hypothetical protein